MSVLAGAFCLAVSCNAAAGSHEPSRTPLHFVHGIPFVSVTVGAIETELMFDSGGKLGITLPDDAIERAGSVRVLAHKSRRGDAAGNVYEVADILADKVSVDGIALANPVAGSVHYSWGLNASSDNSGPPVELARMQAKGTIGLAAFGGRALLFDYAHQRLGIYGSGQLPDLAALGWQSLDLKYDNEGPQITLNVKGKPLRFVLDTGANASLLNPSAVSASLACDKHSSAAGYCGERKLDLKTLGGKRLKTQTFVLLELKGVTFDGILGGDFFSNYLVVFDLAHRKLWIKTSGK